MYKYQEGLLKQSSSLVFNGSTKGRITWESPSNIAIVKYWGKKNNQIPKNPSISFSLNKSKTKTTIEYNTKTSGGKEPTTDFLFEGKENITFRLRVETFINNARPYFPFLDNLDLTVQSENTFPHSAGIASSASSLSSIALCLCSIENALFNTLDNDEAFFRKASFISRLGSGSASRSVYPRWALWGETGTVKNASDEYAIPVFGVHPDFNEINDTVLLVSSARKPVSSSEGHEMMDNHVFSLSRIEQANKNCMDLYAVLKSGEINRFIEIAENEALTLHALMMSSNPGYLLLQPGSISIINKIKSFREETRLPVGFTIDAGPNIHLLSFEKDKDSIDDFIKSELAGFCEDGQWIDDKIGDGPKQIIA